MRLIHAALFAAFAVLWPCVAGAGDVTLRFADGSFEVTGPLLGFDGQAYRVDTRFGELTLNKDTVQCSGDCPDPEAYVPLIRLSGAATTGRLLIPALIEAFSIEKGLTYSENQIDQTHIGIALTRADQPVANFSVRLTNTDEGFADLLADEADIVLADRVVSLGEVALGRDRGLGDLADLRRRAVLAGTDLRLHVSYANAVLRVNPTQLQGLLTGKIVDWADLGLPTAAITMHIRNDEREMIEQALGGLAGVLGVPDAALGTVKEHADDEALVAALADDPSAIAVTSTLILSERTVPIAEVCEAQMPTRAAQEVSDPLVAAHWIYTPARRVDPLTAAFVAYITGPGAQRVVQRAGFMDQTPHPVSIEAQGGWLARAILQAKGAAGITQLQKFTTVLRPLLRLNPALRFEAGTIRLDGAAHMDLKMLAQQIDAGLFDGHTLTLIGFGDSEGSAEVNLRLSKTRADVALQALRDEIRSDVTRVTLVADGFGVAMPLTCESSAWGRHVNRRVEIWVDHR